MTHVKVAPSKAHYQYLFSGMGWYQAKKTTLIYAFPKKWVRNLVENEQTDRMKS